MVVAQVCLSCVEFGLWLSVLGQLRRGLDFRVLPLAVVMAGAGVALPRVYPIGSPTYFSVGVQVVAACVLFTLSRSESVFRSGGSGRRRWI